ncbi:sigma-70 family RNA polymerase sigma factor [Thalassotalea sediminis]|uniref:sigma-70 family RNA polymerase sigma factor n=1 Tax=Thalassotalea sediminis TaxID=1759089 RepID=UPI0025744802|nr:sigma-70 family RNA polymerase sigma factor [Thalassotalea sediminis]
MAVRQINLSVTGSSVTPKAMNDSTEHQQLSQWLISVAEQRDKAAFSELFRFFAPKILRIAKAKIGSEAQASEVVQETMSNIWRKAHLFDAKKGAATTWVYTVMRNVTFDMLRKVKCNREDTLSDDIWPIAEQSATDDELFEDHLASNNIMSVIETLPENQQQVIKGFYFMEMSQEQLANHLDLPLGTIKSRLRLALAKLKAQLGEDHD